MFVWVGSLRSVLALFFCYYGDEKIRQAKYAAKELKSDYIFGH